MGAETSLRGSSPGSQIRDSNKREERRSEGNGAGQGLSSLYWGEEKPGSREEAALREIRRGLQGNEIGRVSAEHQPGRGQRQAWPVTQ